MTDRADIPETVWQDVLAAVDLADRAPSEDEDELAARLYADWYLRTDAMPGEERGGVPLPTDLNLVDTLRAAHTDAGRWLSGWTVAGVSSKGRIAATLGGQRRVLSRVDVIPDERPCLAPRVGDRVHVVARRDSLDEPGAFWFAYGGGWDEGSVPPGLVRVYWHVRRRSTPALVRSLTGHLARTECSYALKVAVEDRDIDRADRAVLYLVADEVPAAGRAIRAAHGDVGHGLGASVPRLSLRLARGLAVAEDPGAGLSFGEHRCRLVAKGIARARLPGSRRRERAAAVLEHLKAAGIDPARPHLEPGSKADYGWLAA